MVAEAAAECPHERRDIEVPHLEGEMEWRCPIVGDQSESSESAGCGKVRNLSSKYKYTFTVISHLVAHPPVEGSPGAMPDKHGRHNAPVLEQRRQV